MREPVIQSTAFVGYSLHMIRPFVEPLFSQSLLAMRLRLRRGLWVGLAALMVGGFGLAVAQDAVPVEQTQESVAQELKNIQSSISLSAQRARDLQAEIANMDGDRERQNTALIASAQRVKLAEIEVNAAEENLSRALEAENEIKTRLRGADRNISSLLSGLQRITRTPPPALIVDPDDAISSARSAMLMSAILPQLRGRASSVSSDLRTLEALREKAEGEREALKANLSTLMEEQLRTATLIEARKRGMQLVSSQMAEEEARAEELAAKAKSLSGLLDDMKNNVGAVANAAEAADKADAESAINWTRDRIVTALADTTRKEPALPFNLAKGYLTVPAAGVVTSGFGSNDGFGGVAQGTSFVTRADAQVVAPADGWVMYKGPYLNYGQIIILNPGKDYSILLAGLDNVSVELGQFVLMGEPLGKMGSRTIGQAVKTSAGVSRPTLYIELRQNDQPIDPATWWTKTNATQNG